MPRSYRLFFAAALGFLTLGNAEHDRELHKHYREEQAATEPSAASNAKPEEKCQGTSQPWLSCDAIAAQAALDQARDAHKQAEVIWPQFGVGFVTLIAAVAAAFFAWLAAFHTKRGADIAEKSGRPWLRLDADKTIKLQFYHDGEGMQLAPQSPVSAKNFGNSPAMNPQVVIKWVWGGIIMSIPQFRA